MPIAGRPPSPAGPRFPVLGDDAEVTTDSAPEDAPGVAYALRRVVVAPDLEQLRGPVAGLRQLPLHLEASIRPVFDFSDDVDRRRAYEVVLQEAASVDDLTAWVNGHELERLWPDLYLPRAVREAWQATHVRLRRVGAGPNVPQA